MRILSKWNRRGFLGSAAAVLASIFAPRKLFSTVGAAAAGGADVNAVMAARHFVSIPDLEVAAGKGIADQQNSCCTKRFHFRHWIRSKLGQREMDYDPLAKLSHGNERDNRDTRSLAHCRKVARVLECQW
jgi:hypothetical protein